MERSPSQSPPTTSGSDISNTVRGERMLREFPRDHVTNLGGGTIGPVYITRTRDGKVLFAEAQLFHAPFKHMVIDTPDLLRMFQSPTQRIDVEALDHPWPAFRLEPREPLNWDVARLERVQYVRSGDKSGYMVKGHPYVSAMKVTPPVQQTARKKSQPTILTEVQGTRHSERTASKNISNNDVTLTIASPTSTSPGGYTVATTLDDTQAAAIKNQMFDLKKKIFGLLSAQDREKYEWVLTTGLKRQGKEGARFRDIVAEDLRALMRSQGERGGELQGLHNQYANLQRKLERRWPYHLPHIDKFMI